MNNKRNNSKLSTIAIITILAISTLMFSLPAVTAQGTRDPIAYVNAVPNPVEINTIVVIHVGSVYPTPSQVGGWTGLSVEITWNLYSTHSFPRNHYNC
jgi:hypothetical protein